MVYNASELAILAKEREYLDYIDEHIKNVHKAYLELVPLWKDKDLINEDEIEDLKYKVDIHDKSKFGNDEFHAYRRYFHSVSDSEKENAKDDFNKAWKHHYENNDHHPEYWKLAPMPKISVLEMVCDWQAMSYKFGGSARKYYEENKDKKKKVINEESIKILEELLSVIEL